MQLCRIYCPPPQAKKSAGCGVNVNTAGSATISSELGEVVCCSPLSRRLAPTPPTMKRVEVAPESTHYVLVSPPPLRRCTGLRVALALFVAAAALLLLVLALAGLGVLAEVDAPFQGLRRRRHRRV